MSSLENGLRALQLFGADRTVLRVNELSVELGIPKSSVSRLMASLARYGFVEKEPGGGYQVGVASLVLRESYFANRSLFREIDEMLFRLVTRFPFTALAATLSGSSAIIVNTKQGIHPLRVVRAVGTSLPAEETATGTCLLARLDDNSAKARIEQSGRQVEPDFLDRMNQCRTQGYLFDVSRRTKGVGSIASAVISRDGDGIAFCLTYPMSEGEPLQQEMVETVLEEAREIGGRFGDFYWAN